MIFSGLRFKYYHCHCVDMPQKRKISDLFPTSWSFFIFVLYMLLFINQGDIYIWKCLML